MRTFGVDIAHQGVDKSCCVIRDNYEVLLIDVWAKADIPQSADRVERLWKRYGADKIIVDCDGIGVGVYDILRQRGLPVMAFHGQARTDRKDDTGELGFSNLRSLAWYNLAQLFNPHKGYNLAVQKHDLLLGDLVCPRWDTLNGRIVVESKDSIKRRLGHSPDVGDAMAYAFCPEEVSLYETNYRVMTPSDIEAAARQGQRPVARSEEAQIDAMLWGGMTNNFDLFGNY